MVSGILAAVVGFAGSFPVVVQGLKAAGASPMQAASGLLALSVVMGGCGIWLSLRTRMPISVAWSTPGAALLASSGAPEGGFPVAIGAFVVSGILIVIAGVWKPLGRLVSAIPSVLASAMLAGILLGMCMAPVKAVMYAPASALPIIIVWAVALRINRLFAVPAAVVVTGIVIALTSSGFVMDASVWPQLTWVTPHFSIPALIGIAVPLFIVTMASQNIPGLAVLQVNKYRPDPGPLFTATGICSIAAAPFGAHAINLAAITAAMCAGGDAHPDPQKRYWAAVVNGVTYIVFGLFAGLVIAFVASSPPLLIEAVAGLALLGAFGAALMHAMSDAQNREAALLTFLVTASGMMFFGIGGAFWGLIAGGAMMAVMRWRG